MQRISSRERFINGSLNPQDVCATDIIRHILNTDMEFEPDYYADLTYSAINTDKVVLHWIDNMADNTKESYTKVMEQYRLFCKMTPAQLIKEALNEDAQIPTMRRHIQKLIGFYNFINNAGYELPQPDGTVQKKEYAPKTLLLKIAPVRSFYAKFGIDIPQKVISHNIAPEPLPENDKSPTKDDIREAVQKAGNLLMKCLIYGQTSSGLASVDILQLSIGQYEDGKTTVKKSVKDEDGNEKLVDVTISMLVVKRQKNKKRKGHEFVTFFSPEVCDIIDAYLEQRNAPPVCEGRTCRETVTKAYMKRRYDIDIENGKSKHDLLLFVNNSISAKFLENRDEKYRKISREAVRTMYVTLSNSSELNTAIYEWSTIRSHKMREFFGNTLENNTSKPKLVRHMMGHKSGAVENAYYRPHQETLKKFYVNECLPLIQFTETEAIRLVDEDFIRLKSLEEEIKQRDVRDAERDAREAEHDARLKRLEERERVHDAIDMFRDGMSMSKDEPVVKLLGGILEHMKDNEDVNFDDIDLDDVLENVGLVEGEADETGFIPYVNKESNDGDMREKLTPEASED